MKLTGWEIKSDLMTEIDNLELLLDCYPLCAYSFSYEKLFVIRKYDENFNCPPQDAQHFRWCIAYITNGSYTYFQLPKTLEYQDIYFIDDATEIDICIKTNLGEVITNVTQLSLRLSNLKEGMTEDDLVATFFDLPNTKPPTPSKAITQTQITSTVLGTLQQGDFDNWWLSKPQKIGFLNQVVLPITYIDYNPNEDLKFLKQADETVKRFLAKTAADKHSYTDKVYKNCTDFIDMIGDDDEEIDWYNLDPNKIWDYVTPTDIYVSREPYQDKGVYLQLVCHCDWEEEHGLQLVFNQQGELVRVSSADGNILD